MTTKKSDVSPEKIASELQKLGFSDHEARSYTALLLAPGSTAYEISKAAGIPKANCYTVLENLSRRGAVQPISENPIRYVVVDPRQFFGEMAEVTRNRCQAIQEDVRRIAPALQQELVWPLNNNEAVHIHIEKMLREAKDHVWMKASEATLEPHLHALRSASNRNIAVVIVLFGNDANRFHFGDRCRTILHEGNGLWVGAAPSLITMTRDFEEALMADVGANPHGSCTRNKPIVNVADSLLRHEIYLAEIIRTFGQEIERTFGKSLINIRKNFLPDAQIEALKKLLDMREDASS